jgi:hypothetical protein
MRGIASAGLPAAPTGQRGRKRSSDSKAEVSPRLLQLDLSSTVLGPSGAFRSSRLIASRVLSELSLPDRTAKASSPASVRRTGRCSSAAVLAPGVAVACGSVDRRVSRAPAWCWVRPRRSARPLPRRFNGFGSRTGAQMFLANGGADVLQSSHRGCDATSRRTPYASGERRSHERHRSQRRGSAVL